MPASTFCHFMGPPSARASSGVLAGSSAFSWPNKQKEKVRRKWHTVTLPSFHLSEDSHVTPCNHRGVCECSLSVCSGRGDGVGKHLGCLCCIHYRQLRGAVCSQFSILHTLVYLCLFTKWTPPFSRAFPARFQIGFESDLQVAFLNCPNENELVPFPRVLLHESLLSPFSESDLYIFPSSERRCHPSQCAMGPAWCFHTGGTQQMLTPFLCLSINICES